MLVREGIGKHCVGDDLIRKAEAKPCLAAEKLGAAPKRRGGAAGRSESQRICDATIGNETRSKGFSMHCLATEMHGYVWLRQGNELHGSGEARLRIA